MVPLTFYFLKAFYQEGQEAIHVIDFKQNAEYLISLPFKGNYDFDLL